MSRADAAELIAQNLSGLPHPDGTILRGMGLNTFIAEAPGDTDAVNKSTNSHSESPGWAPLVP
jgi:hypothetical protein